MLEEAFRSDIFLLFQRQEERRHADAADIDEAELQRRPGVPVFIKMKIRHRMVE